MNFFNFKSPKKRSAIGIIGGADGPTAIFCTTNVTSFKKVFTAVAAALTLLAAIMYLRKK